MVGIGTAVFVFLMILITVNIRKTKESEMSTLLRIMTNYTSLSFNAEYPSTFSEIFYPVEKVGSSSESFLSFDCFIMDYEIKGPFPSNSFFKMFLSALLPLILFSIVS